MVLKTFSYCALQKSYGLKNLFLLRTSEVIWPYSMCNSRYIITQMFSWRGLELNTICRLTYISPGSCSAFKMMLLSTSYTMYYQRSITMYYQRGITMYYQRGITMYYQRRIPCLTYISTGSSI